MKVFIGPGQARWPDVYLGRAWTYHYWVNVLLGDVNWAVLTRQDKMGRPDLPALILVIGNEFLRNLIFRIFLYAVENIDVPNKNSSITTGIS